MSNLKSQLVEIQYYLEELFNSTGTEIQEPGMERFNYNGWINRVWTSDAYRRAHLNIVDAEHDNGLWMMHCCIFPHIHNPAPIFGCDIVAGRNKITGFFHDYSPAGDPNHSLINFFDQEVNKLHWDKVREIPEWGKKIFSPHIIAASNIQTTDKIAQIYSTIHATSKHYVSHVASTNNTVKSTVAAQNFYAIQQKQIPHTPRVMAALGLSDEDVKAFVHECLFPEI
jgi:phycocyanobilin:ferredoxin oxidoreductase